MMFDYIKSIIAANTKERVSAFLAVIAGITLCIGFVITILCMGFKGKLDNASLLTISGGLVALATFSKVDRDSGMAQKIEINNTGQ